MPVLPTPTGGWTIGFRQFQWVDHNRLERYSVGKGEYRDLPVKIFYPAEPAFPATPANLWKELLPLFPELEASLGLKKVRPDAVELLLLATSHSYRDAPLVPGSVRFPVLLFSPGLGSSGALYSVFVEELVSHGYVVAVLEHPYSTLVAYPDGRLLKMLDEARWLGRSREETRKLSMSFNELYREALTTPDEREPNRALAARNLQLHRQTLLPTWLGEWTADSRFVLDRLTALDAGEGNSELKGRLDLKRVGALGHSFGGATAGELLLVDRRFKAAANLDGTQEGSVFGHELPSPFLFVQEDDAVGLVGNRLNRALYDASPGPLFTVQVIGASHLNFSDLALFPPLLGLKNLLGPAEGTQVLAQTNRFLVAFFDQALRGQSSPLLAKESKAPGWSLQLRVPPVPAIRKQAR